MSLTIRNELLDTAVGALQQIRKNNRFPARVRLALIAALKEVAAARDSYVLALNDLIETYGEDGSIDRNAPAWPAFKAAAEELENFEATVAMEPIALDALLDRDPDAAFGEEFDVLVELGVIEIPETKES